ncbi:MAG: fructoselysine kinase, partial [Patescibacteria group bacterium]
MIKLASIGDCCVDIYPQLNQSFLGGSAFNVALTAQKLKTKASLISAVGTDD